MLKKQGKLHNILTAFGYVLLFFFVQELFAYTYIFILEFAAAANSGTAVFTMPQSEYNTMMTEKILPVYYASANAVMILTSVFFVACVFALKKFDRETLSSEAFVAPCRKSVLFSAIPAGVGAFLVALFFVSVLQSLVPAYSASGEEYNSAMELMKGNFALELISSCVLAPISEELLCRGVILNKMKNIVSERAAVLISAAVFGLIHGNLFQFCFTFPLGLLLGYITVKAKSVFPAIVLHAVFNLSNYALNIPEYLGFGADSGQYKALTVFIVLTMAVCIPLGGVLITRTLSKTEKEQEPIQNGTMPDGETKMAQPYFIIAGLGNPGTEYTGTRHNCGFMALDYIALRENLGSWRVKFDAFTAECTMGDKKVLLMKPQTFMNLSGKAVAQAASFYKIPPERVIVIFDDVSFDAGSLRIRRNGSAGGHNGIKSIIASLGSEDFPRIKIGAGKLPEGYDMVNWVLGRIPEGDLDSIVSQMENVSAATRLIVSGNTEEAMARFNRTK